MSAKQPVQNEKKEVKSQWVQTCHIHCGEWVDAATRLPDRCPECKKKDGHGQKARVFRYQIPSQVTGVGPDQ